MLSMEEFIQACRERGLNVTYQRMVIYKYLRESKNHPTAEDIFRMVRQEYPSISLATVYKTLETLSDLNLIHKVTILHDMARYDADLQPHHHLICVHCKKIKDVYDDSLNQLPVSNIHVDGFHIHGYRIELEGICEDCAQAEKQPTS